MEAELARTLDALIVHNTDYDLRYSLVLKAMHLARERGYAAGVRIDPTEPEWPVFYIELPTGQVSWHMPQHPLRWDEHTTEAKFERIRAFGEMESV